MFNFRTTVALLDKKKIKTCGIRFTKELDNEEILPIFLLERTCVGETLVYGKLFDWRGISVCFRHLLTIFLFWRIISFDKFIIGRNFSKFKYAVISPEVKLDVHVSLEQQ